MSKRKSEDQIIQRYQAKIKKLEQQQASRRRRIIEFSESDSDLENEEIEAIINDEPIDKGLGTAENAPDDAPTENQDTVEFVTSLSELDPEIRLALGDPAEETPVYGENIHADLANRWLPILRKGLTKEVKDKLLKEHCVPENCRLLKAPSLNPEISAAVAEIVRARDKKIETKQDQLGLGITAISKAMSLLLEDGKKVDVIKSLSEGCRILSDLHFTETKTRTKLITPCLDKSFLNIIQNEERDDTLFGSKLSEKIKSAKVIEKQGLQIKRPAPAAATKPAPSHQTLGRRQRGNWTGPPRYPASANRGGRGGYTASRQAPTASTFYKRNQTQAPPPPASPATAPQTRSATNRQRAPARQ